MKKLTQNPLFLFLVGVLSLSSLQADWTPPTRADVTYESASPDTPVWPRVTPPAPMPSRYFETGTDSGKVTHRRTAVPADKWHWSIAYPDYKPHEFTKPEYLGEDRPAYAQSQDVAGVRATGELGGIKSFVHLIHAGQEQRPLYPLGRTGISGRGVLGHWGGNQAVDALMVRANAENVPEIFLIYRRRDHIRALPGGMQEQKELTAALSAEVKEEVGAAIADLLPQREKTIIFRGIVEDPRNTDNAWMETTAFFMYFSPEETAQMPDTLHPTDTDEVDPTKNRWVSLDSLIDPRIAKVPANKLYASHHELINALIHSERFRSHFPEWCPECVL